MVEGGTGRRVLGVDPGSRFLGLGAVEQEGSRLVHLGHSVVSLVPDGDLPRRLVRIHEAVSEAIDAWGPDAVAVESLFTFKNAKSALVLAHARGAALASAALRGLPVFEYAPAEVKRAVGAGGAAEKEQVERMVRVLLGLPALERADCADALAVAMCHLSRAAFALRVRAAVGG